MYYKQKLCCYNSTIYEQAKPKYGHCYLWSEVKGKGGSNRFLFTSVFATGADFHRAIVATREKLLIGRCTVRNMDPPYDSKLVFVQKITFVFLGKSTKTAATRAELFDFSMHQIVCWLGLCPIPHWGAYSAPHIP